VNGLNDGVFLLRVHQVSVEILAATIAFRTFRPINYLRFSEQSALSKVLNYKKFRKHVVQAPQRWFNAYIEDREDSPTPSLVRSGDFLVHFAGIQDRDRAMHIWLDCAEQHLPWWEVDVMQTSYPTEISKFWVEQMHSLNSLGECQDGAIFDEGVIWVTICILCVFLAVALCL
jgi:hypothetical protein